MNAEQQLNQWGQIVAKAWQDDRFKGRLLADPAAVFQECGLEVSPGVQLRVVENTDTLLHLTLPAKPLDEEITDEELAAVAGGSKGTLGRVFGNLSAQLALGQRIKDLAGSNSPSQQEANAAASSSVTPSQGAGGPRPA